MPAAPVRLVLLIDGLDEDRSTASGDHPHSIAGLLPADPPAGMRVIVAGRPNPPIPDDVPNWHPLRDPGIVRRLSASPHAQDLQHLGKAELKRLLKGSPVEQDLLGLLAAARGGLSGPDLRELTGSGLVAIEDVLHTVVGRTFSRRTAQWDPDTGPEAYLLGHEELQQAATSYIGEPRLAEYRTRLHTWADIYRTPAHGRLPWPAGTPEYLLRGYPRMLSTTGEVARLVDLVTGPDRHDRMLDLSGGDADALAEINTCQDLVLAGPEPDLEAMLRLCIRRTNLTDRNTNIPANLPAVWATCANPTAPKPSPARSPTRPSRCGRWPRWPRHSRPPATPTGPGNSPTEPRPKPAQPGTRLSRLGRWPRWPRHSRRPAIPTGRGNSPTGPRPWPAPSPTRTCRLGRWPRWPRHSPWPATPTEPGNSPSKPRTEPIQAPGWPVRRR
jgi:hypothetical protein